MQLGLADALLAQNKLEGAAAAFQKLRRTIPLRRTGAARHCIPPASRCTGENQFDASDKMCAEFMSRFAKSDLAPLTLFLSAENRFLAKRYPEAAQRYNECLGRSDTTAEHVARAHFRLAWIHRYAKRHREVLAELDKVDPQAAGDALAAETQYLRGASFFDTGASGQRGHGVRRVSQGPRPRPLRRRCAAERRAWPRPSRANRTKPPRRLSAFSRRIRPASCCPRPSTSSRRSATGSSSIPRHRQLPGRRPPADRYRPGPLRAVRRGPMPPRAGQVARSGGGVRHGDRNRRPRRSSFRRPCTARASA